MRDMTVSRADKDGYISYEMLPTYDNTNYYETVAVRFLKLLLADAYGGLLNAARNKAKRGNIIECVANTDREFKRLAAKHPGHLYSAYDSYRIKTLDINTAAASLLLEIDIVFKGGDTITLSI